MSAVHALPSRFAKRGLGIALAAALALALGLLGWKFWPAGRAAMVEYPMLKQTDIPAAIAVAKDGAVWFTMDFSDAIGVFRNGKMERFTKGKENVEPIGLAVDPQGNAWYTDAPQRVISRIRKTGEINSFPLGTPIARLGRLATGPDGAVWFAESTAYSITRLKEGELSRNVIQSARGGPYGIAVDADGNCWATLQQANQILKITPAGEMEWFWVPTPASAPSDIAVDPGGAVWFLEYRTNKIGRLQNGAFTEYPLPNQISGLAGLAIAPDGTVWFGMLRESALGRLRGGRLAKFPLPRAEARPAGVAVDAGGNVWYVDIKGYLGMLPAAQAKAD